MNVVILAFSLLVFAPGGASAAPAPQEAVEQANPCPNNVCPSQP